MGWDKLFVTMYRIHFNFCGVKYLHFFADQQPSAKVSSHEKLDQSGNASVGIKQLHHKNAKNGGDSRGQLYMQLRTSTEAIDCINMTRIQRKRRIDESKTKTLHP